MLLMIAFSCRQPVIKPGLLHPQQLNSQVFTIHTDNDTTLNTASGAIIKIAKGTLVNSNNTNSVTLEIKEAYTMEQILRAGLVTKSNGQPLSSGGMIYINAGEGQSVRITQAISISIPTPYVNNKMQLFKGDTGSGKVNWTDPVSLPPDTQNTILAAGNQLFAGKCATCHAIGKDLTGPDLAHILSRTPDKNVLYDFTRNPALATHDHVYYCCLLRKFNGVVMTGFPELTDTTLNALYSYIENESKVRNLPDNNMRGCIDSCTTYVRLKDKLTREKNDLSAQKIDMIVREIVETTQPVQSNTPVSPQVPVSSTPPEKLKVTPNNNQSLYYQFTIQSFGWYNIDILLKDTDAPESILKVRITGEFKENISLWLAIPASKVFLQGGLLNNQSGEYGFDATDGTIPLPQRVGAYILAMGEYEDKIVFAKKEFITKSSQQFDLSPSVTTREKFNNIVKNLPNSEGLNISAKKTENADTLRKIIKELNDVEKLKPRDCDCDCILTDMEGSRMVLKDTIEP